MRPVSDFYRDPAPAPRRWLPPSAPPVRRRASALAFALVLIVAGIAMGLRSRPAERLSMTERVGFVERFEREHGFYPPSVAGVRYETDCAPRDGVCRGHAAHHAHLAWGIDDVVLRPR